MHEIGHAVGLSHPFDGGGRGGTTLRTVRISSEILSCHIPAMIETLGILLPVGLQLVNSDITKRLYPTDPGLLDVQIIEHMYGTSTDTNLGNTTYSFEDKEFFLKTIVDSGGVDTIDGSNQTEEVWINLNASQASSIGIWDETEQANYWSGF